MRANSDFLSIGLQDGALIFRLGLHTKLRVIRELLGKHESFVTFVVAAITLAAAPLILLSTGPLMMGSGTESKL